MFWERFYSLCIESGTKPNPVAKELGFSSAVCTKWKNGTLPNAEVLIKIADYFNVSIDYLLGRSDEKLLSKQRYLSITTGSTDKKINISFKDIIYFEKVSKKVLIHTYSDILETYLEFNDILVISPSNFIRCHISFIINLDYVVDIKPNKVVLAQGILIPLSRRYFNSLIGNMKNNSSDVI